MQSIEEKEQAEDYLVFDVTEGLLVAMEDACVTKQELARKMNWPIGRIELVLSGDIDISIRTLAKLCNELGADVSVTFVL